MTSEDALRRVREWEREHRHRAEEVDGHIRYKNPLDPALSALTHDQCLEGAGRWRDYEHALYEEDKTRRLAEAERGEILVDALGRTMLDDT